MRISEADRADLYTGFVEVFGPKRAETMMSVIGTKDLDEVATRGDIAELRAEFKSDLTRLSFILVAGFLGIIATLIGVGLFN